MDEKKRLICYRCQEEMRLGKTSFKYLGHSFSTDLLRCPKCGQVYIPEELARGRMADVEIQLEDK